MMKYVWTRISDEPIAAQWILQCALNVSVDFGLHLTPVQHFGLVTLSAAVLAFLARKSVVPLSKAP